MRGRYKLYTPFKQEAEPTLPTIDNRQRRQKAIATRYYFYSSHCGFKYERCLRELSREFFLSEKTLIDILLEAHSLIKELSQNHITVRQLIQEYPHLAWSQLR